VNITSHAVSSVKIFTNFLFPEFSPSQILKLSSESLAGFHELSLSQILKLSSVSELGMFSRTFSFPNFLPLFDLRKMKS